MKSPPLCASRRARTSSSRWKARMMREIAQGGLQTSPRAEAAPRHRPCGQQKAGDLYLSTTSFSALDYKTDRALRTALRRETAGVTSLIVAQRIGTILDADRIIVLNERPDRRKRHTQGTAQDMRGLSRNRHISAERGGIVRMRRQQRTFGNEAVRPTRRYGRPRRTRARHEYTRGKNRKTSTRPMKKTACLLQEIHSRDPDRLSSRRWVEPYCRSLVRIVSRR